MLERFKVPVADRVYVPDPQMRAAAEAIFLAMGLAEEDARRAADVLIFNDLRGVETHGVSNMLRSYVDGYRSGALNPRPEFVIERETATTATVHGGNGLGLHVAPRAMELAIAKAREFGMGAVGVHHVGHMGGAGYHAMLPLPHDMIGVAMSTSGRPIVVPTWGAEPRLGTNPIAWAAPAETMPPFVFDIGTSQIAANKMRLARRVGAKVAPGWIATADGTPVMEEIDPPEQFFILPLGATRELGSHKGYGLGAVVDILGSVLTGLGGGFISGIPGYHLMAYRIDAFTDAAKFKRDMDSWLRGLAATKPAPGHERVVYAGLLEAEEERRRLEEGIPYHTEVIDWFRRIGDELGLSFDFT
ncbi:MAG: Ldh family oxidoreductase [Chloroflexi bacterium]|nr:Ldh family oxidoreductase [Chloroflexota bacterium]MBM4435431.1 Ldh family oxidoreductase [Chloroflexota bacterium]